MIRISQYKEILLLLLYPTSCDALNKGRVLDNHVKKQDMRKTFTAFLMLLFTTSLLSQNIQLHYDFRHSLDKECPSEFNFLMATIEMYHPDKYGNTFFFVDFDFSGKNGNLSCIYAEVSREFQIGNFPVLPHIEYNGGIGFDVSIANAYLAGAAFPFELGKFYFNTYLAYKYNNFDKPSNDAQFTIVWDGKILKDKLTICGVFDLWSENKQGKGEAGKKVILYGEPQFWYNFNKHFSVGTELRTSWDFYWWTSDFKVYPTLGVKYHL